MKQLFFISISIIMLYIFVPHAHSTEETLPHTPSIKTDAEWKEVLTKQQYYVLREQGTENAFSGEYWDNHKHGTYQCAACKQPLFSSETKFDSGTGWPSYYQPIAPQSVIEQKDTSLFSFNRTEIICASCKGHLGHVFADGPAPTGLRYCINSVAMTFIEKK